MMWRMAHSIKNRSKEQMLQPQQWNMVHGMRTAGTGGTEGQGINNRQVVGTLGERDGSRETGMAMMQRCSRSAATGAIGEQGVNSH
eukprot:1161246-Pelagomonas_calceolata.AAC.1